MSQTSSESWGSPQQGDLDALGDPIARQTATGVLTLAKLCTAVVLEDMRQKVWSTVEANLHEEAEVGVFNVRLMHLTCADVRKAFNTKQNLDQVLQGKSDHAARSVLNKALLAHGAACHPVSGTEATANGIALKKIHLLEPGQAVNVTAVMKNQAHTAPFSAGVDRLRQTIRHHNCAVPTVFQVASTTFQNEQIVLWGMHKINKDPSWRVSECEDALMQSLDGALQSQDLLPYALPVMLAAWTAPEQVSRPVGVQAGDLASCNYARLHNNIDPVTLPTTLDMNIYAAAASRPNSPSNSSTSAAESARSSTPVESQANASRGHMSLEWTLGQQSGVGSTFLVHASWLQPRSGIAAVLSGQTIQCLASKLVPPSVCTGKKMCTGLMVLRSIERVHPSIAPSHVVRQMVSTTQMARLHRILSSLGRAMSVTAQNLMLTDQGPGTQLTLATSDQLQGNPECQELLQRVPDAVDCLFIVQLSKAQPTSHT